MLAGTSELDIKGQLAEDKLGSFFEQLRESRSRTLTLGVLSCPKAALPQEHLALTDFVQALSINSLAGVCGGFTESVIEGWVLPKGPLSAWLLSTTQSDAAAGIVPGSSSIAPGGNVAPTELLLVMMHRKV